MASHPLAVALHDLDYPSFYIFTQVSNFLVSDLLYAQSIS